jgi:hypothetical protein
VAMDPQFIVVFRGVEIGRYDTAERAVGAAQSVMDTELGARGESPPGPPRDLPQIFWQPPPVYFPFDAAAYWHRQASRDLPRYPVPPPIGNQQFQGGPPPPVPPQQERSGPAQVYGGPPAPVDRGPAPMYGGPPAPAPVYGGPPAPQPGPSEPPEPPAKRRWLGRHDEE